MISTSTSGPGNGGIIDIRADEIGLFGGNSLILSQVESRGNGGTIRIESDRLNIMRGAGITSDVFGSGRGSTIAIISNNIQINGTSRRGFPGGISSTALNGSSGGGGIKSTPVLDFGQAGTIEITTQQLGITAGGEIRLSTVGRGDAGTATIKANTIRLTGIADVSTGIFAAVELDPDTSKRSLVLSLSRIGR